MDTIDLKLVANNVVYLLSRKLKKELIDGGLLAYRPTLNNSGK